MHKEPLVLDLDDGCLSVNPLVLCLILDLGQHLQQHFNLIADSQCMWLAQKEAFGRGADQLASLQHHLVGCSVSISRSKLVHSCVQNARQGLQAVVQEIYLVKPLLQSCAALV